MKGPAPDNITPCHRNCALGMALHGPLVAARPGPARQGNAQPQGWQGRGVAGVVGRQKVATPAGSRGAAKKSGSLMRKRLHVIKYLESRTRVYSTAMRRTYCLAKGTYIT